MKIETYESKIIALHLKGIAILQQVLNHLLVSGIAVAIDYTPEEITIKDCFIYACALGCGKASRLIPYRYIITVL